MSLFGSLLNDFDDDPYFGAHLRQMRQMNSMMDSLFANPFGMVDDMGGPLSIMGAQYHPRTSLMSLMPQMNMNRMIRGGLEVPHIPAARSSYSSSTFVMSSGPDGRPQVYSSTSSTQMGPGGIKETRNTVQDSRTGIKKMTIGHHIDERAHIIEKEQNVHSGDLEERQEFINIEEDDADDFNREFEHRVRGTDNQSRRQLPALPAPAQHPSPSHRRERRPLPRVPSSLLALPAPPPTQSVGASARHTYGSHRPQRIKQRNPKHHHTPTDY